jgi:endonuclease-3
MQTSLENNSLLRPTALKKLQEQQEGNPFKILIATILSARSRDENTTLVIEKLFFEYKNAKDLADANVERLKEIIHSIGFYNVKALRIKRVAQLLVEKFGGKVPNTIEELMELPGVGRKTANCVLVYAFNKPAIPVDVHVHRISNRLGIVVTKNPEETEKSLINIAKKKDWLAINETFVKYGQNICLPIKPTCSICSLRRVCEYYKSINH